MVTLCSPQPARDPNPITKAIGLAHLIFECPDLALAEQFLTDFGLSVVSRTHDTLYLRSAAPAAYCYRLTRANSSRFVGLGLHVVSREALAALVEAAPGSSVQAAPHPGGGEYVLLSDPSGFAVEATWGQSLPEALPVRRPLSWNVGETMPRINEPQRSSCAPPEILKLGHLVLEVADFQDTCAWYARHFGLVPSDVQVLPDGSPVVAFLRLDLGAMPADHHTLAIAQGFMPAYGHSAYEVVDVDAIGMSQRLLRGRGWKHAWGIGRHLLGSQVFDYWQDPWGSKHEHYCDGDVFAAGAPTGVHAATREAMAQWGEPMPASFAKPKLTVAAARGLARSLRRSPDVTLRKLHALARLFG